MECAASEWEQHTGLEQISVSYIPPTKVKDTMLGGVHPTNSWVAACSLVFDSIYIDGIILHTPAYGCACIYD